MIAKTCQTETNPSHHSCLATTKRLLLNLEKSGQSPTLFPTKSLSLATLLTTCISLFRAAKGAPKPSPYQSISQFNTNPGYYYNQLEYQPHLCFKAPNHEARATEASQETEDEVTPDVPTEKEGKHPKT